VDLARRKQELQEILARRRQAEESRKNMGREKASWEDKVKGALDMLAAMKGQVNELRSQNTAFQQTLQGEQRRLLGPHEAEITRLQQEIRALQEQIKAREPGVRLAQEEERRAQELKQEWKKINRGLTTAREVKGKLNRGTMNQVTDSRGAYPAQGPLEDQIAWLSAYLAIYNAMR
jgi:chromosome segregation ATPase